MSALDWLRNAFGERAPDVAWAYRQMAETEWGRRVLLDMAAYSNMTMTSFVPGDPHQTAFNEGRRDLYLHVCELANLTPEEIQHGLKPKESNDG